MKRFFLAGVILTNLAVSVHAQNNNINASIKSKVDALLSKMTIEEKVGQMAQVTMDVVTKGPDRYSSTIPVQLDNKELQKVLVDYKIGSVLNTANNRANSPQDWYKLINGLQTFATKKTRLGIPLIYGIDAIHGNTYTAGATIFPQPIAQAATWNRDLIYKSAEITAYEARASSIPWNFNPVLDIGSDPRFPRQFETFGEDPYLVTELGKQTIKGYEGQNNNISDPFKIASCMKHFLGYMVPVSGKDRTPVYLSDQALREYHLPAFKAAVEAGSHTIMINSGIINGIPVHANYDLLTKLLRHELKFDGLIVTDWGDIENLYERDRVAKDHKEAIMMAINAGIDMSMIAYKYEVFCDNLVALVKEGKVTQERLNDAVGRVLTIKYKLGLFERPVTHYKDYPKFGSKEFEQASYQTAAEAITLLKNENNILPLSKNTKVLVTGPNANSMRTLNGGWTYSWQGEKVEEFAGKYNTILEAVEKEAGKQNVSFFPGVSYKMDGKYFEEYTDRMEEALAAAKNADVVLLCIGENTYTETPGNLSDLYLSDLQTEFAQKLIAVGKPVILILNEGRPRIISKFEKHVPAMVQTYLPGNFGGDALADILFGDVNPSGKLPYTYPRFPNSLVPYYHKPSENRSTTPGVYNYDSDFNPQFQFGYGLSYTSFKYGNLKLSADKLKDGETITATIEVSNTGLRQGKEIVQLYTSDLFASITPDIKRLRGFEKIDLKPGEKKQVSFTLKVSDLAFIGKDNIAITEPGEFKVEIGGLTANFTYEK